MHTFKTTSFLFALLLLIACNDNSSTANAIDENTSTENIEETVKPAEVAAQKAPQSIAPKTDNTEKERKPYQLRINDDSRDVFAGEFAYMADAAYFINCSTENKYSVVMKGAFPAVEKAYLKIAGDDAGSKVYAVFKGKMKKKGDKSKMRGHLTVTEVISMYKDINCNAVTRRMGGMYTYMADAGVFIDCKSQKKYAVQTTGANASLEATYLKANEGGTSAYVELEGFLRKTAGMEGGTSEEGLFVTRVIGFDSSYSCE